MHFVHVEALFLLALVAIPIVLFLLPLPRRRARVASTMLWRRMLEREPVRRPRSRLRTLLSILLNAAIIALLVAGFGKLYTGASSEGSGPVVLLLDNSPSMAADDGGTTRIERAKALAAKALTHISSSREIALVTTCPPANVAVRKTSDRVVLRRELAKIKVAASGFPLRETLAAIAPAFGAQAFEVHCFTDACETGSIGVDAPGQLVVHRVGSDRPNAGIVRCAARPLLNAPQKMELSAELHNFSDRDAARTFSLSRNGVPIDRDRKPVTIPAGCSVQVRSVIDADGTQRIAMKLAGERDAFALDDSLDAELKGSSRPTVVLVSEAPPEPLIALCKADASIRRLVVSPANLRPDLRADVAILVPTRRDGSDWPKGLTRENVLIFAPPAGNGLIELRAEAAQPVTSLELAPGDPLLRSVSLSPEWIGSSRALDVPAWGSPVVSSGGRALVVRGEKDGRRIVAFAFGAEETPLHERAAFSLLVRNAIHWLAGSDEEGTLAVGDLPGPEESDLHARLKLTGDNARFAAASQTPFELWQILIATAVCLLGLEAALYHRQITR